MKIRKIILLQLSLLFFAMSIPPLDASTSCYQQLQTQFFVEPLVLRSLSLYKIDQGIWRNIINDLAYASQNVPGIINMQASQLRPNPFYPVVDKAKALELMQKALYSVFYGVLNSYRNQINNGKINDQMINGAFQYIWLQQQPVIMQCLGSIPQ